MMTVHTMWLLHILWLSWLLLQQRYVSRLRIRCSVHFVNSESNVIGIGICLLISLSM